MASKKNNCLSAEEYASAHSQLVDFSFKLFNSNIKGGIRISDNQRRELPYVCLQSARAEKAEIWRDYCQNGGTEAKPYKHFRSHRHNDIDAKIASVEDDIASLIHNAKNKERIKQKKDELTRLKQTAELQRDTKHVVPSLLSQVADYQEIGFDKLNARLPQVLVHQEGDAYLAITPLQSAGLAEHFYQTANNTGLYHAGQYNRLQRSIGGSNSQNAGGLVNYLTSPIRIKAPIENDELRKALGWAFNGVSMNINQTDLKAFIDYRALYIERLTDSQQSIHYRQRHFNQFLIVVEHYLVRLRYARDQVQSVLDEMPVFDSQWRSLKEVSRVYCLAPELNESLYHEMARCIVQHVMHVARINDQYLALREDEQRELVIALKEQINE
ncbi:hypothetical protein [Photobacterium lutimaris]|uniref:Uncharacterized protein n=1 Tax=Photobacterium lutimaris TaxID=388278 RepID=A0A2T3J4R5_9GAMM|nr:hypothetical protein [Photobacterium lutimaris]PSU36281.1 hypothetical protein C9I99_04590 [Photobacterium lutimaris]TDR74836.1 hypothetical protein DFP78_106167 [Photobacterium lutimaris]